MTRTRIDFLSEEDKLIEAPRKKMGIVGKTILSIAALMMAVVIFFGIGVIYSGENLAQTLGNVGLWGQLKNLIGSEDKTLLGEEEDRINVLMLGMGGATHDGPYLTDTMMVASFKPSTNQVALISLPRDLSVNIPGYGWRKINSANSIGEVREPGNGSELAKAVVENTLGITIHYYVRIDFKGFEKIIDDLGGITVNVENTLSDRSYPVPGKETATTSERYEHLYVEAGPNNMNGSLALKFVRSRMGSGGEGSDFARSRRQQLVLMAVKEKVLSFGTLANPYRVSKLLDTLSEHLTTNLEVWEILRMYSLGKNVTEENIARLVFDDGPGGYLYSTITEQGAFILLPRAGNFSDMQKAAQEIFGDTEIARSPDQIPEQPKKEVEPKPTAEIEEKQTPDEITENESQKIQQPKESETFIVEVHNGTNITGLASRTAQLLGRNNFDVLRFKNAPTRDYQKTVIYVINKVDQVLLDNLSSLLDAEVASTVPSWITDSTNQAVSAQTDVLIILGTQNNIL